ncbi:MAG: LysR substrate-binding domain-containing protein, partial [Pseudomonadota bacterium]
MDISSLKVVLLVEAQGSLAGAARVLGVDPSSISRIVSSVESELGIRLFQRTTRRLVVTDEGRTYLQRLGPLLEEMDAAREEATGKRSLPTGILRLTASTAFSTEVIVPHLPEFRKRYPDIAIDLISHDANLDLVENQIDLAIRLAPVPKGDLISTRLMTTAYRVVASPAYLKRHPVGGAPSDVASHDCLRFALP